MREQEPGTPSDGRAERALLDELTDRRHAHRAARLRRTRRGVLLSLLLLVAYGVFAETTTLVAHRPDGSGSVWLAAAVFAALCAVAGRGSAVVVDGVAAQRAEVRALERDHRDLVFGSADEAGSGRARLERRLLDDLDDTRAARRAIGRQTAGYGALGGVAATGLAVGLLQAGTAPSWSTSEHWLLAAAFGAVVFGVAGYVAAVAGGRREASRADLQRAQRRHRELALYDVEEDRLPDPPRRPVEPAGRSRTPYWTVPVATVAAALVVHGPAADARSDDATPTVLAASPLRGVPLNYGSGIAVSPDGSRAYVANSGPSDHPDDTVSVIDLRTSRVIGTVEVGSRPLLVALAPDGRRLYVTDAGTRTAPGRTVSVVDTTSLSLVATVPVGAAPTHVAVGPDGRSVWVTTHDADVTGPGSLVLIDATTDTVAATVPVGGDPDRVAAAPDGTRVYVANYADNTVSVLDTATRRVTATVPVGAGPVDLVVDPAHHTLWVADQNAPDPRTGLTAVDTVTLATSTVDLGPVADGVGVATTLALTPDGRRLLVARDASGSDPLRSVDVVDPATRAVVGVLEVPDVYELAVADTHHAYATAGDLWELEIP